MKHDRHTTIVLKLFSALLALGMVPGTVFAAEGGGAPNTGDHSNFGLWIGVAVVAVVALCLLAILHKRSSGKDKE